MMLIAIGRASVIQYARRYELNHPQFETTFVAPEKDHHEARHPAGHEARLGGQPPAIRSRPAEADDEDGERPGREDQPEDVGDTCILRREECPRGEILLGDLFDHEPDVSEFAHQTERGRRRGNQEQGIGHPERP